ncbi:DNA translocase FtsK 4TM domain-containing protein [uncultured Clostridium sp.]|uniref:FtsK/SpoIIIE family DNA translocase n=1 Tax=uncultured Clostridium sp. TaxID=59620 RepID=UPI0028F12E2D|nr:DNA translocase FtsK 4TM domain-containing protein [uncultured Clostridium sp.]
MGRKKKKKKDSFDNDIKGIVLITIGILALVSVFSPKDSGYIGKIAKKLLIGMFGLGSYIFPFIIIFIGSCYILNKRKIKFTNKFYGIVLFIINTLMCIQMADMSLTNTSLSVTEGIANIYNSQSILHGGIIVYLISLPLYKLFGRMGSFIIFISLYAISFVLISNVTLSYIVDRIKSKLLEVKKKDKEIIKDELELEIETKELLAYDSSKEEDIKKNNRIKIIDFIKSSNIEDSSIDKIDKEEETNQEENNNISEELEKGISKVSTPIEYNYPPLNLLNQNISIKMNKGDKKELLHNATKLEETLSSFGVEAKVIQVTKGPSVTRFELQPSPGIKVSKIVNLSDDISLGLAASGVRIEAPIPGKSAVGIEVPNKDLNPVFLREVIESEQYTNFNKNLAFALGKDIGGNSIVWDLAKMPHLLIAGATGSGKSVCINTLIISLLYKYSPENVKLLMVDPKVVELNVYNGIPHLLIPVVTDPKKAAGALNWAVTEMTRRYKIFAENHVRNLEGYNDLYEKGKITEKLPLIVIIIDELADLMMVCPNDIEDYIGRLAQMARAAGMHLVIATQRPSVDVITGVIKANIPSRISFAVSSQIDSRTILDMSGAEKLLGKGDMLFYPTGEAKPIRVQGAFISEEEVSRVVDCIKNEQGPAEYEDSIIDQINTSTEINEEDRDELLEEAIKIVLEMEQASTSLLQRKLRIGYNRAARIIEQLEERGVISGKDGSKPRQVLITKDDVE